MFSFEGRLGFRGHWRHGSHSVALAIAIFALGAVPSFATGDPLWAGISFALAILSGFWSGVAGSVRRLHDRGLSGWWTLGWYASFPLMLGSFVLAAHVPPNYQKGALLVAAAIFVISTVSSSLVFWAPTGRTPNRYGPPPND